jgi:hypothetical protein
MNKNTDRNVLLIAGVVITLLICCCVVALAALLLLGFPAFVTTGPIVATPVVVPLP